MAEFPVSLAPEPSLPALSTTLLKPNHPHIACETIEGEVIIIHLKTGSYYSLEAISAEIWSLIETEVRLDKIISTLSERYNETVEEITGAIAQFLQKLQDEGLIAVQAVTANEITASKNSGDPGGNGNTVRSLATPQEEGVERRTFIIPTFEKYTDVQDLLLLDPIHEVTSVGWPQASSPLKDGIS